ncbi:MAG: DMT family transporter [Bacillota bacterium]|nr:DMT family transporter [Bacillota bacterium]
MPEMDVLYLPLNNARKKSILLMLICATLWSIAGIFIKLIPWNPLIIAGFRSLIASGVIAIYMRSKGMRFTLNRTSVLCGIMLMLTCVGFVSATKLTTAANAIVLQYTSPIYIMLISAVLYRQRFRLADILTVGFTLFGISLFFFDQFSIGHPLGNIIGLLSGVTMAGMFVTTCKADGDARMSGILLGHIFTTLINAPMVFFIPTPFTGPAVLSILILGVVQLGIPYVLFGIAAQNCPPLACSLISTVEPLLNPVWVFLFAGEAPGPFALTGGAVVLGTITLWFVKQSRLQAGAGGQTEAAGSENGEVKGNESPDRDKTESSV